MEKGRSEGDDDKEKRKHKVDLPFLADLSFFFLILSRPSMFFFFHNTRRTQKKKTQVLRHV